MLAVDTNVLVRYLTNDDPVQSARARRLIDGHDVFVPTTVVLESEWVLRTVYGFPPAQVNAALRAFAGLAHVSLQNEAAVARAMGWADRGMDFADALHLAAAESCESFVTFDRAFVRSARHAGAPPVRAA
ncbi:MAG: type II toxin-antitoxin system VapC family toxin [Acetobacteraceae bacterium]|nr:type II toxin-antitoxin system VapC family toxin [Acetobacteraceae bacterium]